MDDMNKKAIEAKADTDNTAVDAKPKIIAVDFDGCLAVNKWPEIGAPIEKNIAKLKAEQAAGAKVILWTNRVGEPLEKAVAFCNEQGIRLDAVNTNLPEIIEAFGGDTRKIFANEYWDDRAVLMAEEENDWAAKEIELACQTELESAEDADDWKYGVACYESALRAYRSLCRDGHSGYSIQVTKSILNRLIDGKCLTPIEDTPDIWNDMTADDDLKKGVRDYQCARMSSLFKKVASDGTVTYSDVDRVQAVNEDNPGVAYHNGFCTRLVDKIFPITMPYLPSNKKFKVVREELLVDPAMGDYDTVAYLKIITPDGKEIELNRYFKETKDGMTQIDKAEYDERKAKRVDKK